MQDIFHGMTDAITVHRTTLILCINEAQKTTINQNGYLSMLFIPHRCYTLTEQSPHTAPNGAHFQGAQADYSQAVVLRELQWWIKFL